ncbi:3'-5' exonuclease [Alkalibacillus silvisoli]|uniref:Exonuclease domain-containing protein n=1 Tax=Alkalibacillus silvisoli TaxID=392823 RepID=A0ABP3JR63_9BACI
MELIFILLLFAFSIFCFVKAFTLIKKRLKEAENQKRNSYKGTKAPEMSIRFETTRHQPKRHRANEKPEHLKYTKARKLSEDYTVLDFETSGFKAKEAKVIQVAAVKYRNHEITDRYTTNVNPQKKLSPRIKKITGLTDDDVKDAPLIEEVLPELVSFIGNDTVIAHNAPFDMKFLLHNMNLHNMDYKRFRVICTLSLARKNILDSENHKLETLKSYLDLNHYDSHNALDDCYVTGALYKHCYEKSLVTN